MKTYLLIGVIVLISLGSKLKQLDSCFGDSSYLSNPNNYNFYEVSCHDFGNKDIDCTYEVEISCCDDPYNSVFVEIYCDETDEDLYSETCNVCDHHGCSFI